MTTLHEKIHKLVEQVGERTVEASSIIPQEHVKQRTAEQAMDALALREQRHALRAFEAVRIETARLK